MTQNQTPVTGGETQSGFKSRSLKRIREKVSISANDNIVKLSSSIPPNSYIHWIILKNSTAVTFQSSGATSTADAYALVNSSATGTANDGRILLSGSTTLAANTQTVGPCYDLNNGVGNPYITGTSDQSLWIQPQDSGAGTATSRFQSNSTTTTANVMTFSGTADVYVEVQYETFDDLPDT